MHYIQNVLLQLLFALTPFVLYNIYYHDKPVNYSKNFITITCTLCLILSMTFPSSVQSGFIFDIRYVIMFFGLVFGSMFTGLILLVEFVIYRLLIGGEGLVSAMIIFMMTSTLSIVLSTLYRSRSEYRGLITFFAGICFSVIPIGILFLMKFNYLTENLPFHLIVIFSQNSLGIWLLISLFNKAVADKQLYLKFLQKDKVETIGHVAASLAHEVRNPLTAVLGFLKLIRQDSISKEKKQYYIDICVEEIQRTEEILSEYLSIAKPIDPTYEQIDLERQLLSVIEIMTPYARMNDVTLEIHNKGQSLHISANSKEINQLFINFIKNAIEACTSVTRGKVIIRMDFESLLAKVIIHDNGIGMSNEQLDKLGTIYFSSKNRGTGLGLTYSYQLIRSMNGSISVRSEQGKGTEFIITLPVSTA